MTQVDPARELRALIAAYLADELTDLQRSHLNEILRTDEQARAEFAAAMRQEVLLGEVLRDEAARHEARVGSSQPSVGIAGKTAGAPKSPPRRRTARRFTFHPRVPSWIGFLAAAGVLISVTIVLSWGRSIPEPPTSQHQAGTRARAPQEAEGRTGLEREKSERERALDPAEPKHRDANDRLSESEKKDHAVSQPPAPPAQHLAEKESRENKGVELQGEKERVQQVEREMKEAIELAKKAKGPALNEPSKDEKPIPLQESRVVKPELTTQTVIARVEEAAGQVFLVTKEGKSPVTSGGNLRSTEGLETGGGDSRVVLRFPDKTRVELGPETELGETKTKEGKRLWVARGTLQAQVFPQPKDQPIIFATPHGEAKVVGTTLRVTVETDSKKGTRLEVDEGKVEFKNGAGKSVIVEGWHYAVAAEGVDFVARRQDTPTSVSRSGLVVWLRADQGVVLSGSGGVATWADRSGNKHDALQLVPAQQPTLVPNAVQGHPALRFDGVDDCMTFPCAVSGLTGMTIFLVSSTLEERGATNYAANAALYWQETATCSGVVLNPSQSKVWCYFGTGQIQPLFVYTRPTALDRGFSLTTAQKNGPEVLLYVNGQETLRIRGQKPAIGANEKYGQIGRGEGNLVTSAQFPGQREGWTYFLGEIAELMVYTRALGELERKSVEQYLLGKYFSK